MKYSVLLFFLCLISFSNQAKGKNQPKGKLFIIGGGSRSDAMINRLITEAKLREGGYVFILPMASEIADSAIIWSGGQFYKNGLTNITGYNFKADEVQNKTLVDSVENASLIYISGGDQSQFMKAVAGTPVFEAIHKAYKKGAVIAGTSAGAAVMSSKMITGNELKYPEYHETFRHIESENIEFEKGLGLLENAIIDQHFLIRSRHNRLITAVLEYPEIPGIGIDEATAILVQGNNAEVVGNSQVLVFRNKGGNKNTLNKKIGGRKIRIDIYLPGEKFQIKK